MSRELRAAKVAELQALATTVLAFKAHPREPDTLGRTNLARAAAQVRARELVEELTTED